MTGLPIDPEALLGERAWLHRLASHLVRPDEGADELTQDTLTAAMRQPAPRTGNLRTWLAAILRKQLAGNRRSESRRWNREAAVARPDTAVSTLDTVTRFEVQRRVGAAVLALPEPYRTTVLMRFWEGLKPGAISRRTGVPIETVRTRLKRGLVQLRERLDDAHDNDRAAWLLPLWSSLQPATPPPAPVALLSGAFVMTAWSKIAAGGLAVAAVTWLLLATNHSPADTSPSVDPHDTVDTATAPLRIESPDPVDAQVQVETDPQRTTLPTQPARLIVRGAVADDATEVRLGGVAVRLSTPDDTFDENTTSSVGAFELRTTRLPTLAAMELVVHPENYAPVRLPVRYDADSAAPQTIELGLIRVVPGTLFAGRVVDDSGRTVAGAELLLPLVSISYGIGGPQNMLYRTISLGHSEGDGTFRLSSAVAPGIGHRNLLFAIHEDGVGWCQIAPSKQRREVDDLVIRLQPRGGVHAFVLDPTGRPVADALVQALPRFSPLGIVNRSFRSSMPGPTRFSAQFSGRTDALGAVVLDALPIGRESTRVRSRGSEHRYDLVVQADGYPEQPLHGFEVHSGESSQLIVHLLAERRVTLEVTVHDDLGAPIPDARVTTIGANGANGRTDETGSVELEVDTAEKLSVSARSENHRGVTESIQLQPGESRVRRTLTLHRTTQFEGRVVDQTGDPVDGVSLFVDNKHLAKTDSEGRFLIDNFPMGMRRVVVALGSQHDSSHWTGQQDPEEVDAAAGPATIVMQRRRGSASVRATIVAAATGKPLEPTEVDLRLQHESGMFFVPKKTEHELGLVTATETPAGRWRLAVRCATGQRGWSEFDVGVAQPAVDLRLELEETGTVTGRVRFVGVAPADSLTLTVRHTEVQRGVPMQFHNPGRWRANPASQSVVGAESGATGTLHLRPSESSHFQLDSASPGEELSFRIQGEGVSGSTTVRVDPGGVHDIVIEVRAK